MLQALEICEVRIERVAFGGAGVGRLADGMVCFVPYSAPGELVRVRVVSRKKNHSLGELVEVLEPAAGRVEPVCPAFGTCGGCQYQHLSYEVQLEIKRAQVEEALRRIAKIPAPAVEAVRPSPLAYAYRNRLSVHTRAGRTGFFARGTGRVVDVGRCAIASEEVNGRLARYRASRPDDGERTLRAEAPFHGFRQVNDGAAEVLAGVVAELAGPGGGHLVDAYCGAGFFGLRLAGIFGEVTGIEWSAGAVRHARENAPANARFLEGPVEGLLAEVLRTRPPGETCVLFDPPAEGLGPGVIDIVLAEGPLRVIYVSCDPSTLARDAARLAAEYSLVRACPVDMFPQTAQIECACLFEKSPTAQ